MEPLEWFDQDPGELKRKIEEEEPQMLNAKLIGEAIENKIKLRGRLMKLFSFFWPEAQSIISMSCLPNNKIAPPVPSVIQSKFGSSPNILAV